MAKTKWTPCFGYVFCFGIYRLTEIFVYVFNLVFFLCFYLFIFGGSLKRIGKEHEFGSVWRLEEAGKDKGEERIRSKHIVW